MTIPEYDEECDCEFCKEERKKRRERNDEHYGNFES